MSARPHSLDGLWMPRRRIPPKRRNQANERVTRARNAGYRLGRANTHCTRAEYATAAEWAAWLDGHRQGYAEFNRTWSRKVMAPRVFLATERRQVYLLESGKG
jgi:ribosome modulation factor